MPRRRPLPNSFHLEALGVDVERVGEQAFWA
jgi:hypothetical protein